MHEVVQKSKSLGMTLFWVKLYRKDVLPPRRRGEPHTVFSRAQHLYTLHRIGIVAVYKIEPAVLIDTSPQRMRNSLGNVIPAHVRHLLDVMIQPDALCKMFHLSF